MKKYLLALIACAGLAPLSAATIAFVPSSPVVGAGSTFTLQVYAENNTDFILGFGFNTYTSDPTRAFYLSGYTLGPDFTDAGIPGIQVAASSDLLDASRVLLATLVFQTGSQLGPVSIGVRTDLADLNQGLYLLSSQDDMSGDVQINVVPEPSTYMLFGSALLGLGLLRRKRA